MSTRSSLALLLSLCALAVGCATGPSETEYVNTTDLKTLPQDCDAMLAQGVYVIGFSYPVVPHGQARIRIQLSAAHTREQLEQAVQAFRARRLS